MNASWILSLCGGALIGVAASLLLVFGREVAGISGIFAGAISAEPVQGKWRPWFLGGLVLGGTVLWLLRPMSFGADVRSWPYVLLAGALVGVGTRLSGGCTSGHGVCGLSRLSGRSLVATITFITTGVVTVWLLGPKGWP
ncbi:MAG: YeeE/YedE thiosulfate transporter family protein [Deltaproteobacteria bacterium]|nr:YeeE/YedE thiosulfate transporter family protein [Deltaproteobacteria bacterium]